MDSFCTSLEKLHFEISARQQAILEENLHMSHVIGKFRRQLPPCKNLNQLTCAINNVENGGIFLHFLCNILSRKEAQIDLFWVPGIIINQITTRLGKLTALRAVGSYRILQLDIFGHLSSLHTNAPISLLVDKLPYLKVLSCIYDTSIVRFLIYFWFNSTVSLSIPAHNCLILEKFSYFITSKK